MNGDGLPAILYGSSTKAFQVNTLSGGSLVGGLVSYYPMEGNSNDFNGSNNGADTGSPAYSTSNGKVNQGVAYVGGTSYTNIGASSIPALPRSRGVDGSSGAGREHTLISSHKVPSRPILCLRFSRAALCLLETKAAHDIMSPAGKLSTTTWTFVVATYSSSTHLGNIWETIRLSLRERSPQP